MSFTEDKDSDNYITNAEDWNRIKDYIPKIKRYGRHSIVMENKRNILKIWILI